ncbi:hypothetical protein BDN72DRAFT_906813 [Pluteus cervinus]|uniref:Uncharacterized protein n=1 Tax=Pluteus cervinus TaxID=181527 RepID=A0ACD2ZYE3_9AGAR|nr:hypothetical protein BDN72DRAFT_906813 [Pluteus cervinus]
MANPTPPRDSDINILPSSKPLSSHLEEFLLRTHTWYMHHRELGDGIIDMYDRAKSLADILVTVKENIRVQDAVLDEIRSCLLCHHCEEVLSHPHVLICGHVHCGSCLEDVLRPQLEHAIDALVLKDSQTACSIIGTPTTESEFQQGLAMLREHNYEATRNLTTYKCPCCPDKSMETPPLRDPVLSRLCSCIRSTPDEEVEYFSMMFMRF